jgi:hypothetical protein
MLTPFCAYAIRKSHQHKHKELIMFNAKAHEAEIVAYNERWERIAEAIINCSDWMDMQTARYAREMLFSARRCPTMAEGGEFLDELEHDILCGLI